MTDKYLTPDEKQEIYSIGFDARLNRLNREDNPYHKDTEEYEEWDYGWAIARAVGG